MTSMRIGDLVLTEAINGDAEVTRIGRKDYVKLVDGLVVTVPGHGSPVDDEKVIVPKQHRCALANFLVGYPIQ